MGLVSLEPGAIAEVAPVNSNFTYLDGRITAETASINQTVSSHSSSIATLNSNVAALQNTSIISLSGTNPTLTDNSVHRIQISGNTTFNLPTISDNTKFHQMLVLLYMPTVYTINLGTTHYFYSAPNLSSIATYTVIYECMDGAWYVGAIQKVY